MKINNFRGDFTEISAIKEPQSVTTIDTKELANKGSTEHRSLGHISRDTRDESNHKKVRHQLQKCSKVHDTQDA